jgi:hypothetical protein
LVKRLTNVRARSAAEQTPLTLRCCCLSPKLSSTRFPRHMATSLLRRDLKPRTCPQSCLTGKPCQPPAP